MFIQTVNQLIKYWKHSLLAWVISCRLLVTGHLRSVSWGWGNGTLHTQGRRSADCGKGTSWGERGTEEVFKVWVNYAVYYYLDEWKKLEEFVFDNKWTNRDVYYTIQNPLKMFRVRAAPKPWGFVKRPPSYQPMNLSRTRNNDTSDALVLPFLLGHRHSKEQQISLPRNSRLSVELTHLGLLSRDICLGNTFQNYTSSVSLESPAFIYELNPVDFLVYFPVLVSLLVYS